MKVLSVDIYNLNSLRGKHRVSFDEPPLSDAGLFAIVGRTGAGKTTILDAITLALYGRTPRDRNGDNIMSWGTGECHAEVEFSCRTGRYRARWERRRARGKAEGNLQASRREVSRQNEDGQWEILAGRIKKEVEELVAQLSGLDFDRFTRSIMLPQGEFARFLRAPARDRSELLESITGTQLYSELSTAAYDRHQLALRTRDQLKERRENLQLLRPEERQAAVEERKLLEAQSKQLKTEVDELRKKLEVAENLGRLQEEQKQIKSRIRELRNKQTEAKASRETYQASVALRPLAADLQWLDQASIQIVELRTEYSRRQEAHRQLSESLPDLTKNLEQAKAQWAKFQEELPRREERLAQARDLELKIQDRNKLARSENEKADVLRQQIQAAEAALEVLEKRAENEKATWNKVQRTLAEIERAPEKDWSEEPGVLREQLQIAIGKLERERERLLAHNEYRALLREDIARADAVEDLKGQIAQVESNLLSASDQRLEAEATERLSQEAVDLIRQQEQVTDLRKSLSPEKPCPVCGSIHHPALIHWTPPSEALRQRTEADLVSAQQRLKKAKADEADLLREHAQLSARLVSRREDDLLRQNFALRLEKLESFFAREKSEELSDPKTRLHNLAQRKKRLLALQEELKAAWNQRQDPSLSEQMAAAKHTIPPLQAELAAAEKRREERTLELEKWQTDLDKLLGGLSPAAARKKLDQQADKWRAAQQNALDEKTQAETKLAALSEEVARIQQQVERNETNRQDKEVFILAELAERKIDSIATAQSRLLDVKEEQSLGAALAELDRQLAAAQEVATNLAAQIEQLSEQSVDEAEVIGWRKALDDKDSRRTKLLERQGALQEKLSQDELRRTELGALLAELEAGEKELGRWARLNELIGQKDGAKFRKFAQGLTLARLVQLANHHLRELNGRYLLHRPGSQDLELEVVDTYQADNHRPTHTLSGGESFVLSLALALGLSDLAGRNTRIESLFIDEGFGTLDGASLDLVLDVLDKLRGSGKTIGLISHVPALRERIHHQVRIVSESDGFGHIEIV